MRLILIFHTKKSFDIFTYFFNFDSQISIPEITTIQYSNQNEIKTFISCLRLCALVSCSSCTLNDPNEVKAAELSNEQAVAIANAPKDLTERGKYLTVMGGCADCHSPKKMSEMGPILDPDRYMMGYPADQLLPKFKKSDIPNGWIMMSMDQTATIGPWGISYAANLTPDATGIGNWSYENFKTALVKGKYMGQESARSLMPPMPWQNIGQMNDDDMRAMFAYLQSLKPIENLVPAYTPPTAMK